MRTQPIAVVHAKGLPSTLQRNRPLAAKTRALPQLASWEGAEWSVHHTVRKGPTPATPGKNYSPKLVKALPGADWSDICVQSLTLP